jgi:anion-transporting  ArsA/GET3 family ATPase
MTIDPAPRLLDALGLGEDAAEPHAVDLAPLASGDAGTLRAMRLDPKATFDEIVTRYAPTPAAAAAILRGRIYQNLSNAMAGVADYMAMERVLALSRDGGADLIVLDTPPARAALDFLDAPRRMLELIGSRALTLLGATRTAARGPFGLLDSAARAVLGLFDRFSGLHLLADVQEFVRSFDGMYEGFASRAADAAALLHDRATAIVLVSTTDEKRIAEIQEFAAVLDQRGLRINAVIVNRAMPRLGDPSIIEQGDLPAALAHKLRRCLESYNVERARESRALEQLRGTLPPATRILIASDVGREPSSIRDLLAVADGLRVAD